MNAYSLFKVLHRRVAPADDFILEENGIFLYVLVGGLWRVYYPSKG